MRRPRATAPSRNGAGRRPRAAERTITDEDIVNMTGPMLAAAGLPNDMEDDDDVTRDAEELLGVNADCSPGTGAATPPAMPAATCNTNSTDAVDTTVSGSASSLGKRKSAVWDDFDPVEEDVNGEMIRTKAICKMCRSTLSARSVAGTGHLLRHQKSCKAKVANAARIQTRLACNPDGSLHNWNYDPAVARTELCRLICRLDLPLGIGDSDAWEEYIQRAHNPRFVRVSRRTTTRDLGKLFAERRDVVKNVLSNASCVALTSDIWSGNAKEDYISVVAHYVNADWEMQKRVIGLRLIEVSHSGENIAERVAAVVEQYGLLDKVFSVTLDNASANSKAMETLTPMFAGYLGPDPVHEHAIDPNQRQYSLVHQRCACHIMNLIVKSGLKRLKPYLNDFRTAINFLNSSNQRVAQFKDYCIAKNVRPRKFALDMDVRWNATYLMLKHLVPYAEVFDVFINSNYGSALLTPNHWYTAGKVLEFLELFFECTVVLSGVYYPTSPLVLHHVLEIATHLHDCERDLNLRQFVYPMQHKFNKYWKDIPLLYSFAFILDPRAKMRGFFNVLNLLAEATGSVYTTYYDDVKAELYKLFSKYERKYGAARTQRAAQPSNQAGKRKQAWGRIFGGSGVAGPPPHQGPASAGASASASASACARSELTVYLDSDNVTSYEDEFDILLWWRDHKLTYPVLSIMAKDIMAIPVSTISSESCFSLTGRIIEERRRRLLPETVEMLACLKDWELGEKKEQHEAADTKELEDAFNNLFLDEGGDDTAAAAAGG